MLYLIGQFAAKLFKDLMIIISIKIFELQQVNAYHILHVGWISLLSDTYIFT